MKLLLQQAIILDTHSQYHLQKKDILLQDGLIMAIENNILDVNFDTIINAENCYLSTGFTDIFANFNEPGLEQNETLLTGANAAFAGGYTTVCIVPNTNPTIDNKTSIEFVQNKAALLPIQLLAIGAITTGTNGKQLTEMIEMQQAGAIAFSDGLATVQSAGLLLKAMQYINAFEGTIIQLPNTESISSSGYVNEGITSTQLGLMSIPAIAEEMMVARDISLCAHTKSKLHITGISTSKSIALIKAAKKQGLPITCSVTPYHLTLTETVIANYNTNAKVINPLRTTADVTALQNALLDGTIDCVASHHTPIAMDGKKCEFANAKYGMSTIEQCFEAIASIKNITPEKIYEILSANATTIFGIKKECIAVNNMADATLFSLSTPHTITNKTLTSKGINSALAGLETVGKILATFCKKNIYIA